jgi:hypothetical protein
MDEGELLPAQRFVSGSRRDRNGTVGELVLRENRTRMTRINRGIHLGRISWVKRTFWGKITVIYVTEGIEHDKRNPPLQNRLRARHVVSLRDKLYVIWRSDHSSKPEACFTEFANSIRNVPSIG